jgi:hypothetical protein
MSGPLRIHFGEPISGWMPMEVNHEGITVSFGGIYFYHYPSLYELTKALYLLLLSDGVETVIWYTEPVEYEMKFSRKGDLIALTIDEFPDHLRSLSVERTRLMATSGSYEQIALPFWRAMRGLQGRYSDSDWMQQWQRVFPTEDMQKWTACLQQKGLVR